MSTRKFYKLQNLTCFMKQVILDTSFILTCVKQKIDFFEDIKLKGLEILIPEQVIREIERLKNPNSELALKIISKNSYKSVNLGRAHVDKLIIRFAKENPKIIVATLDREIKEKVRNPKLVIRGKKKLSIM